jgi:hypothetical protein
MARPRVFVSSTYYDLKHVRSSLESFIDSIGYEAVLFESGDIPFHPDLPLDESCYAEIHSCHLLVLMIGGRYGSPATALQEPTSDETKEKSYTFYNSITRKEYETAKHKKIPVFVFVEKNVLAEHQTYKKNRTNPITYAHVDNIGVFKLLDDIISQPTGNFVKGFENHTEVIGWLRDQWAGLFADYLARRQSESTIKGLSAQIAELASVAATLKGYSESVIRKVAPEESEQIIAVQRKKLRMSQVVRVLNEPLIHHVIERFHKLHWGPSKLYRALEKAQSIADFLEAIGARKEEIKQFLDAHADMARSDFAQIRERYFEGSENET